MRDEVYGLRFDKGYPLKGAYRGYVGLFWRYIGLYMGDIGFGL